MSRPEELLSQLRIDRRPGAKTKRRRWPWILGAAIALLVIVALLGGRRALPVETSIARDAASAGPMSLLDASGFVVARRIATVSAKVTGKVREVFIEEGQAVREGEVLATLEAVDANAALGTASAQLSSAQSQLAEAEANLTLAERNLARNRELSARQLVAKSVLDQAIATRDANAARLQSLRRSVEVARAQVGQSRVSVDNTVVRAPFSGVIVTKSAQPGEMISPISGGGGSIRTGIGTLVDMDSLEVEVDVNEAYIGRVKSKMPVDAVLNAYPEWKIPGEVIAIVPTADRSKATVRVRIALNVKDPRIVPDMGVRVSFLESRDPKLLPQGVWVPAAAVQTKDGKSQVFIVDADKAKAVSVELSEQRDAEQLLSSGLKGGEQIITAPLGKLRDGAKVSVKPVAGAKP